MKILAVGMVEELANIHEQISKQTIQPDVIDLYIDEDPAVGINNRRNRIADNMLLLREKVIASDADLIWQVEGDGVFEDNTLERLLGHYFRGKDGDVYSGIEVGRHGLYCIGAWHINADGTEIQSVDYQLEGIQKVDAMGLYCFLTSRKTWLKGYADWEDEVWGPDVNFFLSTSADKYVDMGIQIGHKVKNGIIRVTDESTCNAKYWLENGKWEFKQL